MPCRPPQRPKSLQRIEPQPLTPITSESSVPTVGITAHAAVGIAVGTYTVDPLSAGAGEVDHGRRRRTRVLDHDHDRPLVLLIWTLPGAEPSERTGRPRCG